jgi:hypothetical protein
MQHAYPQAATLYRAIRPLRLATDINHELPRQLALLLAAPPRAVALAA